jgi:hypothetical protein
MSPGVPVPGAAPIPPRSSVFAGSLLPGEEAIVVLQRGPAGDPSVSEGAFFPGEKAHQAVLAGYDAVVFVNHHAGSGGGTETVPFCGSGAFVDVIVGVCTTHIAFHKLFNTTVNFTYPEPPAIGALGEKVNATAASMAGAMSTCSATPWRAASSPRSIPMRSTRRITQHSRPASGI